MIRAPLVVFLTGLITTQTAATRGEAATIRQLTFTQVVEQAAIIVRGRVVSTRSFRDVSGRPDAVQRQGVPPRTDAGTAAGAAQAPQSGVTENTGRMIFTEIEVQVSEYISGAGNSVLRLVMPGGMVDGVRAWIPGLPTFSQGEDVVLFLRQGFERAGDPAVGVNQGVFRIVGDPATGVQLLLDANQRIVTGIQDDRVVSRANPAAAAASARRVPGNAGAPTPTSSDVAASSRDAANAGAPMSVSAFMTAVNARLRR
jgi:hypothetical protein